jgi:ATP-dependent Clp protease ATP-binding subunit ClpA
MQHVARFRYAPWSRRARLAVFYACYEAGCFGRGAITTEDLLLGILREDRDLEELVGGVEAIEEMRRQIEGRETTPRQSAPQQSDLPLDSACRSALALAKEETQSGAPEATPRHLLAGIVQQEQTLAAQLLRQRGIGLERLRRSD